MEILLATTNLHKAEEFRRIFRDHTIILPSDRDLSFTYEETGESYFANAMGKAQALFHLAGGPVLADDSGLSVDALGGAPGIRSARFGAGTDDDRLSAEERNSRLLETMKDIDNRRAFFVCCLVLLLSEHRYWAVQETVEGRIASGPRGDGGFGYDPLFNLPDRGCTVAELPDQEKDGLSHRGRAARRIMNLLSSGDP